MARLKDIAEACGVSIATVSRVLNGHQSVNRIVRERVLQVARDLDYRPNSLAQNLVHARSDVVGLLVPSLSNPFFPQIVEAFETEANYNGFRVFLGNTFWNEHKERSYIAEFRRHRVAGVVLLPTSEKVLEMLNGVPAVVLDKAIDGQVYVRTDNHAGMELATKHLLDLGHTRIALVGNTLDEAKYQGYVEGLGAAGIDVDDRLVLDTGHSNMSVVMRAFFETLGSIARPPTAVVCFSDKYAARILMLCQRARIRVPNDLAVVGYDNTVYAETSDITSVAQPQSELGRVAAERLLGLIKGSASPPSAVVLQPKLVVRGSSSTAATALSELDGLLGEVS